jgi:hypothetical protein
MRKASLFGLISFAFLFFILGPHPAVAQNTVTGTWKASAQKEKADKIHISFERTTDNGGRNQHGSGFSYSDLQGLTPDQTQNGRVSFRLVREAGTIECEGAFTDGKGSGTFTFIPSQAFVDAMRGRGFDFAKFSEKGNGTLEDRLFAAATINVTTALADGLLSANFGPLGVDDLFKAAIFKITPEFMTEMKATGFPNLGMEELVKARIFKIDPAYVREVREMGFDKADFENMVKFRIFKVTPQLLSDLRNAGLTDLSTEDVVKIQIFKIDTDYIRQARAEDPSVTVEQLVQRRIGVGRR